MCKQAHEQLMERLEQRFLSRVGPQGFGLASPLAGLAQLRLLQQNALSPTQWAEFRLGELGHRKSHNSEPKGEEPWVNRVSVYALLVPSWRSYGKGSVSYGLVVPRPMRSA